MTNVSARPTQTWALRGVLSWVKPQQQNVYQSGLLMSVIRTLSASESNEQRDREKARLEREYHKSDQRLDHLITNHDQSLKDVMQIFGEVSGRLADARKRIRTIKENLAACKRLLHCKRDELKERWLEGVEHKHVMLLLEQIDEVRDVGERVGSYVNKKHYLHATQLLVTSLNRLGTDLKMVEALKDVNLDLHARKEKLHEVLIDELHKHLYQRWTKEVLALRRQGSGRDSTNTLTRAGSDRASLGTGKADKARKNLLEMITTPVKGLAEGESLEEDVGGVDPEANTQHFMAILVECLALLGKLPDAVETIKRRMQKELGVIIQRTTQQIVEYHPPAPPDDPPPSVLAYLKADSREAKLLQELLQVVFEQFRLIVAAHQSVLVSMRASSDKHGIELHLYSMPDVWSKVQAALQVMLSEYLDLSQLGTTQQQAPAAFTETATDLSSFFTKKRTPRIKNYSLFKFEASYHAMTMNSYLMEQAAGQAGVDLFDFSIADGNNSSTTGGGNNKGKNMNDKTLVCPASPHNITAIFNPLQTFIREIEDALACSPGDESHQYTKTHCTLHVFITDYIKDAFLAQLHVETAGRLEQATKALDQWRTCRDPTLLKTMKVNRPLLQSSISVWQSIEELRWLLGALPLYADHFVSMMCNTLMNYRETCQAAYRGITQPDSEDKRIISATWAKDEDISRFLRDLPNWRVLQAGVSSECTIGGDENPEEVGERNRKEAEILTGNLGDQLIPQHEILADPAQLRTLGHLQESLEWFGSCIVKFATSLPVKSTSSGIMVSGEVPPVSDASVQTLTSLAKDFEELAHTCLLVLHLEVRLHCFFYLLPVARGGGFASGLDSQEPDNDVLKLIKDLATIDEALTNTLHPRKCKYIFEGLGPLIANILMTSVVHIRRINENGIKKMCRNIFSIQQQLTNITMTRELALDQARQYYEMLYHNPDEILNGIMNRGKQFAELEYINALQLLHRSSPGLSQESLHTSLQRLSEILGDIGVTV
ncbi:exocyst complex component 4-like isoform X2 [Homarus americanus]|uniref:exocyst complex component 4-like isoform X2 n=1 Tax=Homarus americanus TaxID=6706 RepID=UPI001C4834FE|nr:exocyst complex component 4-like isoform X2 [Homarus americanus]XP_042242489.1 exocyst complex component 4-like isoform X2 [Homarus americanus]